MKRCLLLLLAGLFTIGLSGKAADKQLKHNLYADNEERHRGRDHDEADHDHDRGKRLHDRDD